MMSRPKNPPKNPPQLELCVLGLQMARQGAVEFLESHGPDCDCIMCEDARGVLWTVDRTESCLTSQMFRQQEILRDLATKGFPGAEDLACMVHYWRVREKQDDAEYRRDAEKLWDAEDLRRKEEGEEEQPAA